MDSVGAFFMGEAARRSGAKQMVFDWHKAARLIKESRAKQIAAGLRSDWEYTGAEICDEKGPLLGEEYGRPFLASCWATPEIELDGVRSACFVYDGPESNPDGWDEDTYWPESALKILRGGPDEGVSE